MYLYFIQIVCSSNTLHFCFRTCWTSSAKLPNGTSSVERNQTVVVALQVPVGLVGGCLITVFLAEPIVLPADQLFQLCVYTISKKEKNMFINPSHLLFPYPVQATEIKKSASSPLDSYRFKHHIVALTKLREFCSTVG